jgi:hypothetical protein|nr:MAG TPA: metalloprotein [Caudoviricetes sp.]
MQTLKMDFQSQSAPPVVPVMQFDAQSRFIGITLYNGGVPYEAPEGASYTVQYCGPGANNMGWYDTIQLSSGTRKAVIVDSASKNVVTLELAEQALRVSGNVFVNLCVVTNTGYMLKTFPILCRVTGAAFPDTVAVQSFFYVTGITSEQWLAYVTACQDAQKRAEDAATTFETDPTLSVEGKAADAAKVGEEVGQLKEDLTEKIPLGIDIKNYLDSGNMTTDGYIDTNTGNVIDYNLWCYSDYIATKPGATLCTIGWDSKQNGWNIRNTTNVAFYNANKTFISGYIAEAGKTYNVPKSCSYMRVSFSVDELNYSPLIVEKDAYDKMALVEDRIPYGNFIPTIYDKMGGEYVLIRNPYCVKSYDKLFFKFDMIVFYKNGVQVQLDYNFLAWKEMFPNNWQGYTTSKMSDCVFLKNNEIFTLEVKTKKPKIITRPYFLDNPEKYVLILGYDSTNQSYGPFDEQYRLLNDDSYERQRFESLSNETLTKLYDQASPVYKILSDEHFCFAWLSDNHMYGTAGEDETDMTDLAIGEIDKTLNFNAIFNTGDSIQEREGVSGIKSLRKIANRFDPDKLVFCEGNHDRNVVSPRLTKTEFYNVVYRQTKNKNIVWGSKENAYYYRDFPTYKIRVIVLNVYEHMYDNDKYDEGKCGYSNTQLEWLANKALQTLEDWSVIVLTHDSPIEMAYNGAANQNNAMQLVQILEAFKDGNNIAVQYTDERNSGLFSVNVTTAFSTPGTLIAVLSGHAHCDDAKKVNGINYVQIVCAYIDVVNDYSGYKNRPAFSSKAYAFDIGIINTVEKSFQLKRIGYGNDRNFTY